MQVYLAVSTICLTSFKNGKSSACWVAQWFRQAVCVRRLQSSCNSCRFNSRPATLCCMSFFLCPNLLLLFTVNKGHSCQEKECQKLFKRLGAQHIKRLFRWTLKQHVKTPLLLSMDCLNLLTHNLLPLSLYGLLL